MKDKVYKSDYYIGKNQIEINYSTINNYMILQEEILKYDIEKMKVTREILFNSFKVTEEGLGLCSAVGDEKNITFYSDDQWCEIFSSLDKKMLSGYCPTFAEIEVIKDIIDYNVFEINKKSKNTIYIPNRLYGVEIRDENNNMIALADDMYIVLEENAILLNKIIKKNKSLGTGKYLFVPFSDEYIKISLVDSVYEDSCGVGCTNFFSIPKIETSTLKANNHNLVYDNLSNLLNEKDNDDEDYSLDLKSYMNNGIETDMSAIETRILKNKAEKFNKKYKRIFIEKINLIDYLLN